MKLPAWTYSQLDAFETCPKQFYEVRVAKNFKDNRTEASIWGDNVHKALESRLKEGTPLPEGMTQWEPIAAKMAALPGQKYTERRMALDVNFQPTEWDKAWTRGIVDVDITHGSIGGVYDWKTGKRKLTNQLKLYAAYKMAYDPNIEQVVTGFIWLKDKKVDKEVVTRADLPQIWNSLLPTVRRIEKAYESDKWMAKPNGLCKAYCPVTSCQFNGRR